MGDVPEFPRRPVELVVPGEQEGVIVGSVDRIPLDEELLGTVAPSAGF